MDTEQNLELFRNLISLNRNLYYWKYSPEMELLWTNCPSRRLYSTIFGLRDRRQTISGHFQSSGVPLIIIDIFEMVWICAFEKQGEVCRGIHVIGPAFHTDASREYLNQLTAGHNLSINYKKALIECLEMIPVVPTSTYYEYGAMLHYCLSGERICSSDLAYQTEGTLPVSVSGAAKKEPLTHQHAGIWQAELNMLKMVEEGNLNYKAAFQQVSQLSSGIKVRLGNPLRQAKDSVLIFVTLCSRAAIRGGLSPENAYTLQDLYIQTLEDCKTISDCMAVSHTMYEDFLKRVHKCRQKTDVSVCVKSCCDYIDMHIYEKTDLQMIADRLNYTRYYLSRKFQKEMGISINDYIRNRKVEEAKLLLRSTSQSVLEISNILNFCSRSHFTDSFRKVTGLSPSRYREEEQRL